MWVFYSAHRLWAEVLGGARCEDRICGSRYGEYWQFNDTPIILLRPPHGRSVFCYSAASALFSSRAPQRRSPPQFLNPHSEIAEVHLTYLNFRYLSALPSDTPPSPHNNAASGTCFILLMYYLRGVYWGFTGLRSFKLIDGDSTTPRAPITKISYDHQ